MKKLIFAGLLALLCTPMASASAFTAILALKKAKGDDVAMAMVRANPEKFGVNEAIFLKLFGESMAEVPKVSNRLQVYASSRGFEALPTSFDGKFFTAHIDELGANAAPGSISHPEHFEGLLNRISDTATELSVDFGAKRGGLVAGEAKILFPSAADPYRFEVHFKWSAEESRVLKGERAVKAFTEMVEKSGGKVVGGAYDAL